MLVSNILLNKVLPKFGNSVEECEDSFSIKKTKQFLKIAISDGATESSFAKEWADILVKELATLSDMSGKKLIAKLPKLREKWLAEVTKNPLPWYAEAKLEKGAFSTILCLKLDYKKQSYDCIAIGDCCLFHVRGKELISSFPVQHASAFSNNPFLLSTRSDDDSILKVHIEEIKSRIIEQEDYLFIMSDALAHWFMKECEEGERPWEILIGLSEDSDAAFEDWLDELRKSKEIKNDDTTLIIIKVE